MGFRPRLTQAALRGNMARKGAIASLVALILLAGVFFRLYHVNEQGFWGDEGATAHYVAGYLVADVQAAFRGGRVLTAEQLRQFEVVSDARGPWDTIRSLAMEDAGHGPVYYVLGHEWLRLLGGPPTKLRLLTALLSLLLLPAAYWLAVELFESRTTAWIATCLVAVSPFWVEYAQQAREYSLWAALTAASSALLLRALRTESATTWALYFLSLVLSLYCFFFAVFVMFAHVAFVCVTQRFRITSRPFLPFLLCIGAAVAFYVPWLIAVIVYMRSGQNPYYGTFNIHGFIHTWMVNLAAPFFDLEYIDARLFLIVIGLIILIGWSFACLLRYSTARVKVFVACLVVTPLLVFMSESIVADATRYAIPALLGIQLTVAFAIGRLFEEGAPRGLLPAAMSLGTLIVLGIASCGVRSQQHTWWVTQYGAGLERIAAVVNHTPDALLVTDDWVIALDISPFLKPTTRIKLTAAQASGAVNPGKQAVFVYSRSTDLAVRYTPEYDLVPLPVTVPRRGWTIYSDMLHRRGNGSQGATTETWLWRVMPKHRGKDYATAIGKH